MMKKGFFDKVFLPGGTMKPSDFRGTERMQFLSVMEEEYGYNRNALRSRLFYRGFDEWMIKGIDHIKDEFAVTNPDLADWREEKDKSYFELVKQEYGRLMNFSQFLRERGLLCYRTTMRRFEQDDWKPWERIGMQKILTDYCDRY